MMLRRFRKRAAGRNGRNEKPKLKTEIKERIFLDQAPRKGRLFQNKAKWKNKIRTRAAQGNTPAEKTLRTSAEEMPEATPAETPAAIPAATPKATPAEEDTGE